MNKLERLFLERLAKKLVIQGNHKYNITEYFKIIINAANNEFTEDTIPTLNRFLTDCFCEYLPSNTKLVTSDIIDEKNSLLSDALRAICLTHDYVGENVLPAKDGWEWYDTGKKISEHIKSDEWAYQFKLRINEKD